MDLRHAEEAEDPMLTASSKLAVGPAIPAQPGAELALIS
jgi:hypothetical protein